MGLVFTDGCDSYNSSPTVQTKWTLTNDPSNAGEITTNGGPFGTNCFSSLGMNSSDYLAISFEGRELATATESMGASFWLKQVGTDSGFGNFRVLQFFFNGDGPSAGFSFLDAFGIFVDTDTGVISITGGDGSNGSTVIGSSPSNTFDLYNWQHIEMWFAPRNSGGTAELWHNGVKVIDVTGADTITWGSGTTQEWTSICIVGVNSASLGPYWELDDMVFWDSIDDGRDNDMTTGNQGILKIETIRPNGAGSNTDWTASAGSNWEAVNEANATDADYVTSGSSGDRDTYAMETITTGIVSTDIKAVVSNVLARKDTASFRQVDHICVSSGSTSEANEPSGGVSLTTASTGASISQAMFTADPATTTAWTTAGIDAIELGFQLEKTT